MSYLNHNCITSPEFPDALGPYSAAVTFGALVFVSGQGAADPRTGELVATDIQSQTGQGFRNIEVILKEAGSDLQHIIKCGVFLVDMTEFSKMNGVYERVLDGHKPARSTVQVAGLPMEGLRVEIDAIAYRI